MIERLPGWVNFLLLVVFYVFLMKGVLLFWEFAVSMLGENAVKVIVIFAAGYLAKYRWQGGGWRFW